MLVFAYCSTLIRPVLPTIADKLAHTFSYKEHLANVHNHYGHDHVFAEYAHNSKSSTPINNNILADEIFSSVHLISMNLYTVFVVQELLQHFANAVFPLFYVDLKVDSPPPRA